MGGWVGGPIPYNKTHTLTSTSSFSMHLQPVESVASRLARGALPTQVSLRQAARIVERMLSYEVRSNPPTQPTHPPNVSTHPPILFSRWLGTMGPVCWTPSSFVYILILLLSRHCAPCVG